MSPLICDQPRFLKRERADVLNLASNELQHPRLKSLLNKFVEEALPSTKLNTYPVYKDALSSLARLRGLPVDCCALAPGSDPAIRALIEAFGATGHLIISQPGYRGYSDYAAAFGLTLTQIFLRRTVFSLDPLIEAVRSGPQALVVLVNPDGIIGHRHDVDEVAKLARVAYERGSLLLVDEAYSPFASMDHSRLVLSNPNLVVVRSYSKSHGVAGLRLATVVAEPGLVEHFLRTRVQNGLSTAAIAFLFFSITQADEFIELIDDMRRLRDGFATRLRRRRPSWWISDSCTNFVFIDTLSRDDAEQCVARLAREGIEVRSMSAETGFEASLRITVPAPADLARIENVLFSECGR